MINVWTTHLRTTSEYSRRIGEKCVWCIYSNCNWGFYQPLFEMLLLCRKCKSENSIVWELLSWASLADPCCYWLIETREPFVWVRLRNWNSLSDSKEHCIHNITSLAIGPGPWALENKLNWKGRWRGLIFNGNIRFCSWSTCKSPTGPTSSLLSNNTTNFTLGSPVYRIGHRHF